MLQSVRMKLRLLFPLTNKQMLWAFLLPLVCCLIIAFSLAGCNNSEECGKNAWNENFWGDPFVGTQFCEATRNTSLIGERVNALSNFGYIYFGLVVFFMASGDRKKNKGVAMGEELNPRNIVTMYPIVSATYGVSMLYLGFASFIFHSGGNEYTYAHDQASIFDHFILLVGFALGMFIQLDSPTAFLQKTVVTVFCLVFLGILMTLNLTLAIVEEQALKTYYCIVAMLVVLVLANMGFRLKQGKHPPTWFSFGLALGTALTFVVALLLQEQFTPLPCDPDSRFQFHAVWHVLTAIGFFVLYLYFRSNHFGVPSKTLPIVGDAMDNSEEEKETV